jgi:RNA polymerase sigma factor (sigma-70 family)
MQEAVVGSESYFKNVDVSDDIQLGIKLAWKLLGSWNARLPEDEVRSLVGISICEARKNYKPNLGTQFQTFLFYHLRGRLLREISSLVKYRRYQFNLTEEMAQDKAEDESATYFNPISDEKNPEELLLEQEASTFFNDAMGSLDWLEGEVVQRHCISGESLLDIASELDYCRCHLSRVKTRAMRKLRSKVGNTYFSDILEEIDNSAKKGSAQSYSGGRGRRGASIKKAQLKAKVA